MLLQHICIQTPDKADYRNKLVGVVFTLMNLFDDELYARFVEWIYKFSRNTKVSGRGSAMRLVMARGFFPSQS